MILSALKYLSKLAQEAVAPAKIEEASGPRQASYLWHGGQVILPNPKPPRAHSSGALREIIELANRFGPPAVIWFDEAAIVLVIDDDGHRCEKATMALEESDAFTFAKALRGRTCFNQKQFVKMLRIDLAGCLDPGALLNIVKCVKFETGSTTAGTVDRKKESLGKTINAAVNATEGDIPEVVTLSVPVFKTAGVRDCYPIRCTVDVDAAEATFRLIPFPDEIEAAQQAAMEDLHCAFKWSLTEGVYFYYGSP